MSANLTEIEIPSLLERLGLATEDNAVHVACINSPTNVTLSGPANSIKAIQGYLDQQGVFAKTINTGVAYHSPVCVSPGPDRLMISRFTSHFQRAMSYGACLSPIAISILILVVPFPLFLLSSN